VGKHSLSEQISWNGGIDAW